MRRNIPLQHFNGSEWLNAISRCRQYGDSEIFPGVETGTAENAQRAMLYTRTAFESLRSGSTAPENTNDYDAMAHCVGISLIRAIEIAGGEDNPMLDILRPARDSVERMRQRWQRMNVWGFDGPGLQQMVDAIDIYETILEASTPAQMEIAMDKRRAILKRMAK